MTTRKRRTFEPSLKLEVVRLINEQGQSVQNVSESMGIGQTASVAGCSSTVPSSKESANWSWKISNYGRTLPS